MKGKKGLKKNRSIWLTIIGLVALGLLITGLLRGTDVALFNPKGLIAEEQRKLMVLSIGLLLGVALPTLALLYFIAWKYRETNEKAKHAPRTNHRKKLVFIIWAIPIVTMLLLASIMWPATHKLAPQKAIDANTKPLNIQVVALRWKWLFIYPEQNIATVNFVQIPADTPVQFDITADETPMSSFWIPHLGGQLYAMTGHVNRLNLMAEEAGDYPGSSAEINGSGFSGMKFIARVSSAEDFDQWMQEVKSSSDILSHAEYEKLLAPSENNATKFYAEAESNLYDKMLMKYTGSSHNEHAGNE